MMQTKMDVAAVVQRIALCDFETNMREHLTSGKGDAVYLCRAGYWKKYRYFTVTEADTKNPKINLLADSESTKEFADVVVGGNICETVSLWDLVEDNYLSAFKGLKLAPEAVL